ncbi:MAG: DUF4271 domain-containing protein, partial [Alistipes sp.]
AAGVNLIATAALMIVFMAQIVVLYLIGATTLTQTFSHELIYIKRSMLALATILMTPMVLFYTFSPIGTGQIWIYIILSGGIIITILFLLRTLTLFLSQKISILHWFLYLCTVELLPISLLWLLIARQ